MKRLYMFIILVSVILVSGCMGTKEYYQAQTAYYQAQTQANVAHTEAMNNRQPLAEMIAPDGTRFVVNQTSNSPAPVIRTTKNPLVEGVKTVVNSTPLAIVAGGWTAGQILKNSQGDITASDGSTVTSTSNSNNTNEYTKSEGNLAENSNNDSSNNSDNSTNENWTDDNSDNSVDNTSEPTVVEQPEPIITEQPDPIIVEQPAYNEPVIVGGE